MYVDKIEIESIEIPTGVEDKTQILRTPGRAIDGKKGLGYNNEQIKTFLPLEEGGLDRLATEGVTMYKPGKDGLPTDEIKFQTSGKGAKCQLRKCLILWVILMPMVIL